MTAKPCKQCTYPIDRNCIHQQCDDAHNQGFCSKACKIAYEAIKAYELAQAEKRMK